MTPCPAPSARQASRKAADAADRLLDWLKQQGGLPAGSGDEQVGSGYPAGDAEAPSPDPPMPPIAAKCEAFAREGAARGLGEGPGQEHGVDQHLVRRAEPSDGTVRTPLRPAHTDWLHYHLLVAGPAATLASFQAAACGSGTIPWQIDLDQMEEDLFLMLAAPPPPQRRRLCLTGSRVLAAQLRIAAERHHAAAVARVGQSRACPFDLHALVPVPDPVLQRGPDHPDALAWLWTHWGTTAALRHVAAEPIRPRHPAPDEPATLRLAFWSADWTPWRALATVAARWPALHLDVRPTYGPL